MEQLTFAPEKVPIYLDEMVPVDELPPDEELAGPAPTADLVDSIRRWGIQVPVLLHPVPGTNDDWRVVSGRRRIKAARLIGLEDVPARIVVCGDEQDGWVPDVLTLMAHATQHHNPVADLEAIEGLLAQGADERAICQATGLTLPVLRKRMRLLGLRPALREALVTGRMAVGVAERAAKLDAVYQDQLAAILAERGRITGQDVEDVRKVGREAAQADLIISLGLADMPGNDDLGAAGQTDAPATSTAGQLHKAIVDVIQAMRDGDDLDALITRIMDLEAAFKAASMEGII